MKKVFSVGLIIFIITGFFVKSVFAQNKTKEFDKVFSALAKNRDFNGNVLIAENGKIVYEKSFGYADFPSKRLNAKNTVFPFASISKSIMATAILQQVEKGNLRLDERAAKYLPEFPYAELTIKNLLSHTSGMPAYGAFFEKFRKENPERVFTNADFIWGLNANKQPLIYKPGESWNYDNTNFVVLALILEKVSGENHVEYVKKHILEPAGMNDTFFFQNLFDANKNKIKSLVIPHLFPRVYSDSPIRADSIEYVSSYWKSYHFSGFGDYVGTARDLLKYDKVLYDGTLVGEKVLSEAFVPVKLNNGKENSGYYGLGWTILKSDSKDKIVFHTGGAIGLNCILYRNLTKHRTVIAYDIANQNAFYIAASAEKILDGEKVELPKKSLTKIYGKLLFTKGEKIAAETLEKLSKDKANYEFDKEKLIKLGYEFLGDVNPYRLPFKTDPAKALEVFKICVRFFPDYWNSYDSYGDALARSGDKELAIKMYQKSLELKPDSESGKKALEKLLK